VADLSFTTEELETLRVALQSAYYSAADEERHLADRLAKYRPKHNGAACRDCELDEHGRVEAARRMQRYHLLTERVLAAKGG
jgi:hypothetical protein